MVPPPVIWEEPHGPLPAVVVKSSTTVPGGGSVDVDVLELVEVVDVVVPTVLLVVGTPVVDVVVTVEGGTVVVASNRSTVPASDVAPGPGSEVAPFMSGLVVPGTQKADTNVASAGTPMASGPAGLPVSRTS